MNGIVRVGLSGGMAALLGLLAASCEFSTEISGSSKSNGDLSGVWLYSNTAGAQSTWALVETGNAIISGAGTEGERINGSVTGDSIYLSLSYSNTATSASVHGTVSGDTMTGTFTNSAFVSGSWSAVKSN